MLEQDISSQLLTDAFTALDEADRSQPAQLGRRATQAEIRAVRAEASSMAWDCANILYGNSPPVGSFSTPLIFLEEFDDEDEGGHGKVRLGAILRFGPAKPAATANGDRFNRIGVFAIPSEPSRYTDTTNLNANPREKPIWGKLIFSGTAGPALGEMPTLRSELLYRKKVLGAVGLALGALRG